jgi:hypothetical protein
MQIRKLISTITIFLLLASFNFTIAQFGQPSAEKKDEFKMQKRIFFGGGLDFGISSYSTILGISPIIGYRLSPSFDVGLRLNYSYYRYNDNFIKFSTNNYGAGVFGRYYLFFFNDLFLHAEYEALNNEVIYFNNFTYEVEGSERVWISSLFIGGGYRQWIGSNAFVGITVLWNLLDDINSPYSNPIFRIGVGVGI